MTERRTFDRRTVLAGTAAAAAAVAAPSIARAHAAPGIGMLLPLGCCAGREKPPSPALAALGVADFGDLVEGVADVDTESQCRRRRARRPAPGSRSSTAPTA
jgi:hypothetical protein